MKLRIKAGSGRVVKLDVKKVGFFGKILGLMFRSKKTCPLLFEFSKENRSAIHSYFVFFDFLAVWLDSEDKIVDMKRIKPFQLFVKPYRSFKRLIEIPFNVNNEEIIKLLVGGRKV